MTRPAKLPCATCRRKRVRAYRTAKRCGACNAIVRGRHAFYGVNGRFCIICIKCEDKVRLDLYEMPR